MCRAYLLLESISFEQEAGVTLLPSASAPVSQGWRTQWSGSGAAEGQRRPGFTSQIQYLPGQVAGCPFFIYRMVAVKVPPSVSCCEEPVIRCGQSTWPVPACRKCSTSAKVTGSRAEGITAVIQQAFTDEQYTQNTEGVK